MADFTNIRLGVLGAVATKYVYDVVYRPDLHYSRPSLAGTLFCIWYFTIVYFITDFTVDMGALEWLQSMYTQLLIGSEEQLRIKRMFEIVCMFYHALIGVLWYTHSTVLKVYDRLSDVPWDEVDRLYGYFLIPIVIVSGVKLVLAA